MPFSWFQINSIVVCVWVCPLRRTNTWGNVSNTRMVRLTHGFASELCWSIQCGFGVIRTFITYYSMQVCVSVCVLCIVVHVFGCVRVWVLWKLNVCLAPHEGHLLISHKERSPSKYTFMRADDKSSLSQRLVGWSHTFGKIPLNRHMFMKLLNHPWLHFKLF
jgi:hypothetical protein